MPVADSKVQPVGTATEKGVAYFDVSITVLAASCVAATMTCGDAAATKTLVFVPEFIPSTSTTDTPFQLVCLPSDNFEVG